MPSGDDVLRRLPALLTYPREDLDIEIKPWLGLTIEEHRANLAQALLALANHGGGYVLLGYAEDAQAWGPALPRPETLSGYSQDVVQSIVQRYADPPFQCAVHHVPHPQTGELFPIVVVPGGHRVPIRSKRGSSAHVAQNTYYIRRPGPESAPPQSAREWDELLMRCLRNGREELLGAVRGMLYGAGNAASLSPEDQVASRLDTWIRESRDRFDMLVAQHLSSEEPPRYHHGVWTVGYALVGDIRRLRMPDFREVLNRVRGHETGWPPWWVPSREGIEPYPHMGVVECWLKDGQFDGPAYSDFWRASPEGLMFLLRGYQEDSVPDQLEPGTTLGLTIPMWRVGECLLHAQRLAAEIGDEETRVLIRFSWEGLMNRSLARWGSNRTLFTPRRSRQDVVSSETSVQARAIGHMLPEAVLHVTRPLYEVFEFFEPPLSMVQEELDRMQQRSMR